MEIKEYFLQKDIDIDNVRKSYYFMQENTMTREEVAKVELDEAYKRLLKNVGQESQRYKKEQFLNAADNQTQNLNGNPQNPNLTNPGSGKFLRDYDKEPIIIKDYKQNLSLFSALLTLALVASLS